MGSGGISREFHGVSDDFKGFTGVFRGFTFAFQEVAESFLGDSRRYQMNFRGFVVSGDFMVCRRLQEGFPGYEQHLRGPHGVSTGLMGGHFREIRGV